MGSSKVSKVSITCTFCDTLNRVELSGETHPICSECGRPILIDRPVRVTDQDLERVVAEAGVPVLVDFYADWCGPCKMMAPVLDDVARDRRGQVLVAKLDTDGNPTMAVRYGIRGIPTLILFRDGREFTRQTGAIPRQRLDAMIDSALAEDDE